MSGENLDLFAKAAPAPPRAPAPEARTVEIHEEEEDAASSGGVRQPEPTIWTVSQVNRAVRRQLEQRLPQIWVTGEIANFAQQRSGHCYFTLKDESAQLRCVMFRREAERLPALPEEGTSVTLFGGLTLYEARGSFQMVVQKLQVSDVEGLPSGVDFGEQVGIGTILDNDPITVALAGGTATEGDPLPFTLD
ncbi:MAG: exodeoxyribonuclease VII large subunit, partial [Gemmatimonadetes bacterium]|nr:exodeoxyribonuclease VII large subunit [Gemmatimonadota bacterium]